MKNAFVADIRANQQGVVGVAGIDRGALNVSAYGGTAWSGRNWQAGVKATWHF